MDTKRTEKNNGNKELGWWSEWKGGEKAVSYTYICYVLFFLYTHPDLENFEIHVQVL